MADPWAVREAFLIQRAYCDAHSAPITGRIAGALADSLTRESRTGARVLDWPGDPTADALPLRLIGGLHALDQAGAAPDLSRVFAGEVTGMDAVALILADALIVHDAALLPWLDGPPQTNEPGRSAVLMTGLLELARRFGPKLELLEIGSSAGLNLLIDRYRFDLGGTNAGPADAPVLIRPEWRGAPPPQVPIDIVSVRGCDLRPLDTSDAETRRRLMAYIWADNPERHARMEAAFAMLRSRPVDLAAADAADWVEARLDEPQARGVTRVLMHSVVWQYLPVEGQRRIRAAMEAAGACAIAERPLAWVRMEPDRGLARQELWLRHWPGGGEDRMRAIAHAHGLWVETL
ncbi:DUF2332 domain-containing protein [Sphingosinithalassobacter sp. LHW66-3]|uniref:DUF2332 domain-containing protein n=1 Tax=Sphingosinithalassobacter sp. LHW66-3 TaxID=3424718 RepID=UPI003D6AF0E8